MSFLSFSPRSVSISKGDFNAKIVWIETSLESSYGLMLGILKLYISTIKHSAWSGSKNTGFSLRFVHRTILEYLNFVASPASYPTPKAFQQKIRNSSKDWTSKVGWTQQSVETEMTLGILEFLVSTFPNTIRPVGTDRVSCFKAFCPTSLLCSGTLLTLDICNT